MADIFLCYRRDDSAGWVRALYNELKTRFGARRVFIDHNIPGGAKVPTRIMNEIQRCAVFLVVIGKDWLPANVWDTSRLNTSEDWVRLEITAALKRRKIQIIPVLVHGAAMPTRSRLPSDLLPLLDRNAVHLRENTWDESVASLLRMIEPWLPAAKPAMKGRVPAKAKVATATGRGKSARAKEAKPPTEKKPGIATSSAAKPPRKSGAATSSAPKGRQPRRVDDSVKTGEKPRTQKPRAQPAPARKTAAPSPARKRGAPVKTSGGTRHGSKGGGKGKTKGRA